VLINSKEEKTKHSGEEQAIKEAEASEFIEYPNAE
jgi:hypothetical protein